MLASTRQIITTIEWNKLNHAYGKADNVLKAFEDLLGANEDLRDDAVNEFLLSSALHQGTTYSCTPKVAKCVLHILKFENMEKLKTIGAPLLRELFMFLDACRYGAKKDPLLELELQEGIDIYQSNLNNQDIKTAVYANELYDLFIKT